MKIVLLTLIGLSSGFAVSAGVFALITSLGILQRLASRTHTAKNVIFYENCIIAGGTLFNFLFVFNINIFFGKAGLIIFGAFTGIFVGVFAMALAEVLRSMPILSIRIKLTEGIPYIIVAIAIGKIIGSLLVL